MMKMKWERVLLVAFFGNYLINNVVAGIASLIPPSTTGRYFTVQYMTYVVLAAIVVALVTRWYFAGNKSAGSVVTGSIFGVSGFIISILATLVSGVAGVLAQSGSLSQVISVLPNFGPFLWSWSTLFLLGFWVIPGALVGWWIAQRSGKRMAAAAPAPMMGGTM